MPLGRTLVLRPMPSIEPRLHFSSALGIDSTLDACLRVTFRPDPQISPTLSIERGLDAGLRVCAEPRLALRLNIDPSLGIPRRSTEPTLCREVMPSIIARVGPVLSIEHVLGVELRTHRRVRFRLIPRLDVRP